MPFCVTRVFLTHVVSPSHFPCPASGFLCEWIASGIDLLVKILLCNTLQLKLFKNQVACITCSLYSKQILKQIFQEFQHDWKNTTFFKHTYSYWLYVTHWNNILDNISCLIAIFPWIRAARDFQYLLPILMMVKITNFPWLTICLWKPSHEGELVLCHVTFFLEPICMKGPSA